MFLWAKSTEWGKTAKYAGQDKLGEQVSSLCSIRKTESGKLGKEMGKKWKGG